MAPIMEHRHTHLASPKQLHEFATQVRNAALEEAAVKCEQIRAGMFSCDANGYAVDAYIAQWRVLDEIRSLK